MEHNQTLVTDFLYWENKTPNNIFLRQPQGDQWIDYSWFEVGQQARKIMSELQRLGLKKGDHVGLISKNCAHWIMADIAMIMGGFVSVPFYPNIAGNQLKEVIQQSDIKAVFLGKVEDFESQKTAIPEDIISISFPHYPGNSKVEAKYSWEEIIAKENETLEIASIDRNDLWTILFTSGTTGTPKGVMLNFGSISKLLDMEREHKNLGLFQMKKPRFFSYLPLNHIAERTIVEAACLSSGGVIYFAESLEKFPQNLQAARPTLFLAVPRIWTKFQQGILTKINPKTLNVILRIPIISSLFKKKIKKTLGLDQAELVFTGAAAISESTKDWYRKLGIELKEVFGMTETCGGCTLNIGTDYPGSVGLPLQDVAIKIDNQEEILVKLPWGMVGYYNDPEKTNEVIRNGWIHTGDIGRINANGSLSITGRVKDAFKSDKGQFIVPGPMESKLSECLLVDQICIVGIGLPQPIALVLLSEHGACHEWTDINKQLSKELKQVNAELANYQQVKKIVVLNDMWDVNNGLLTPTLKVKRSAVHDRYKASYQDWYSQDDAVIEIK